MTAAPASATPPTAAGPVVLPAVAVTAADGVLVARSDGRALHVATPHARDLTPTGRLRRHATPLCGQRARRWQLVRDLDGRPLCARCARTTTVRRGLDGAAKRVNAWAWRQTLRTARDEQTLHAARIGIFTGPHTIALQSDLRDARTRLERQQALTVRDRTAVDKQISPRRIGTRRTFGQVPR